MTWDEIKEIDKSSFGYVGHHSHTHKYLIEMDNKSFIKDIETATKIFKNELGYVPSIFSYPFGEYSLFMKNYISKNFELGFGQHSGIIDLNKDKFELPRFPINEKYGDLKRFKSLINYYPLQYKNLNPEEKKLNKNINPPKFYVEFFPEQKNIKNINCYSNEGDKWEKSKTTIKKSILSIEFREPFVPRRGRINCSLNDEGKWRWFGTQFTIVNN
jgi:peptidoglycan/xylan/chitin deacetylase (PgdA/CDA1 family)